MISPEELYQTTSFFADRGTVSTVALLRKSFLGLSREELLRRQYQEIQDGLQSLPNEQPLSKYLEYLEIIYHRIQFFKKNFTTHNLDSKSFSQEKIALLQQQVVDLALGKIAQQLASRQTEYNKEYEQAKQFYEHIHRATPASSEEQLNLATTTLMQKADAAVTQYAQFLSNQQIEWALRSPNKAYTSLLSL